MIMKQIVSFARVGWRHVVCAAALSLGTFVADASPQTEIPTPTQFQKMVPDNAIVQYTRNRSGKAAVEALSNKLGIDPHALAEAIGTNFSKLGPDPLGTKATVVTATWVHSAHASTKEALSDNSWGGSSKPMTTVGDTYTTHWSSGGWNYSATYTWNGNSWELTKYTAEKAASSGGN